MRAAEARHGLLLGATRTVLADDRRLRPQPRCRHHHHPYKRTRTATVLRRECPCAWRMHSARPTATIRRSLGVGRGQKRMGSFDSCPSSFSRFLTANDVCMTCAGVARMAICGFGLLQMAIDILQEFHLVRAASIAPWSRSLPEDSSIMLDRAKLSQCGSRKHQGLVGKGSLSSTDRQVCI
jgi:hypothetical protein